MSCLRFVVGVIALSLAAQAPAQSTLQGYANFESTSVHPIRISTDGARLFAVHTPENRLSVFDLADPRAPALEREIPVGLEPISVTARTADEVWVASALSDSVSVVDPNTGIVLDILRVKDEASDVAFAGGKAFVSAALTDEVHVFDAVTREPLGVVPIFGKEPRALAVSHDGESVFALVHRSGNGTTIVARRDAPAPPPPTNPDLPLAPQTALIVRADDPEWAEHIPFSMPDSDVFEIDVTSLEVVWRRARVGTMNFDLVQDPESRHLLVSNSDLLNHIRFEPELRGRFAESRITRIRPDASMYVVDLNADVPASPVEAKRAQALADVAGIALDGEQGWLYVAAQGTDRVGVFDLKSDSVVARIDVGNVRGASIDTPTIRGPRGLALHPSGDWLYVHNRLSDTISVIDTQARRVVRELPIGTADPVSQIVRKGRKFLYDAKRGNGTVSCASCHIDADSDNLAWDLGDPGGELEPVPEEIRFDPGFYPGFHPMKGPMTTAPLRGLVDVGPLHWRGDRPDFAAFNGAFESLLGGDLLTDEEMDLFAAWSKTVLFPSNPNQRLDRGLRDDLEASEQEGFDFWASPRPQSGLCGFCHPIDGPGTAGGVVLGELRAGQPVKIAHLRNLYRKVDFDRFSTEPQKIGFGTFHDGANRTGGSFEGAVSAALDPFEEGDKVPHVVAFLKVWDTGTAPLVGYQARLDASTAMSEALASDVDLLEWRAAEGDVDLVALGKVERRETGLLYDPDTQLYQWKESEVPPVTRDDLLALATAGRAHLVFTGAFPGTGRRIAVPEPRATVSSMALLLALLTLLGVRRPLRHRPRALHRRRATG